MNLLVALIDAPHVVVGTSHSRSPVSVVGCLLSWLVIRVNAKMARRIEILLRTEISLGHIALYGGGGRISSELGVLRPLSIVCSLIAERKRLNK